MATPNEKHYSVDEVAEMWGLSADAVRKQFINEEGVLKLSAPRKKYKRTYTTLRIPESVLNRVYARLTNNVT